MDMAGLLQIAFDWPATAVPVLATVVRVRGHAYRKEGAAMLFLPDGRRAGSVSGGCVEEDLQARTAAVSASGRHVCVTYNLKRQEDAVWGEALGCGGEVTILLEAVSGELLELLRLAHDGLARGAEALLIREWDDGAISYTLSGGSGGTLVGDGGGRSSEEGRQVLADWTSMSEERPRAAITDSAGRERGCLALRIQPKPRLILFGDGQDAGAVAALAEGIGFRSITVDWREGLEGREGMEGMEGLEGREGRETSGEIVNRSPAGIVEALRLHAGDYLLLCSHKLRQERELLELVLPLRLRYIGVLGSRARIGQLFEGLERTANVHAPVGLPIGADGPKEIAVSIAAQLIAVRRRAAEEADGLYGKTERAVAYENRSDLLGGRLQPADG